MIKDIENQYEDNKNQNIYDALMLCSYCLIGTLALGILAGQVAYIVFGIMFLVKDYPKSSENCGDLYMWTYVLVCVILSTNRFIVKSNNDESKTGNFIPIIIFKGFIELGLAIWGGIVVFNTSCHNNLWKFGLASFIIQVICATSCLIFVPTGIYCISYFKK